MIELQPQLEFVLKEPSIVCQSKTDNAVHLYYRYYEQTIVGAKWLCVVVKYFPDDAFIITAYLTDRVKHSLSNRQS